MSNDPAAANRAGDDLSRAAENVSDSDSESRLLPRQPLRPRELGGPEGLEPTRYGDWERNGRCSDF